MHDCITAIHTCKVSRASGSLADTKTANILSKGTDLCSESSR